MKLFSMAAKGFFDPVIHGENVPEDAIEISETDYQSLMVAQSEGMAIDWSGLEPVAVERPTIPKPARLIRDEALEALVHDFGDGRVIQVRPQDEPNFERAYRVFALTQAPTIDWVMADNVKHPVTEAELREAHDAGIVAGAAIWDAYNPGA